MTTPTNPGGDTRLAPKTDQAPGAAPPAGPTPPRMRRFWPALAVTVAAMAALTVWTLTQLRGVDEPVDTPAVVEFDPWIQERLRERNRAFEAHLDPWAQAKLRERNRAFETHLDPWAQAKLRERNRAFETHRDPWVERARAQQAAGP